jgi:Baseplate J-like protein
MVNRQYHCKNQRRRLALARLKDERGVALLNGIDYLEVSADRQTLLVYCLHPVPELSLKVDNFQIQPIEPLLGKNVPVESINIDGKLITLGIRAPLTTTTKYHLQTIDPEAEFTTPATNFDPQLFQVEFAFGLSDISEFDCETPDRSPERPLPPPTIDYLAKDYNSFRQLMLDRLAVTMPEWKERSPADLGVMLVELVAYSADRLSYYQDAVATEAYLGTARKRVSVRRHARLLNYPMHDGCNARGWVVLQVKQAVKLLGPIAPERGILPYPGTRFLTKRPNLPSGGLDDKQFKAAVNEGAVVFETMYDVELNPAANQIQFYTWGDGDCYLPKGTTQATLQNPHGLLDGWLKRGTILILEEIGISAPDVRIDPNPAHRHPVLITEVKSGTDPLFGQQIIEIKWGVADRLPFDLIISQTIGDQELPYSIVRGNAVLVDHGRTVNYPFDADEARPLDPNSTERVLRLAFGPITQQGKIRNRSGKLVAIDFDLDRQTPASAAAASIWELPKVMPAVMLSAGDPEQQETHYWYPQRDLLNSDRFTREFVVETEDDGRAYLRFGDGNLGRKPKAGVSLTPFYRVGNGSRGNVGAEAIAHIYDDRGLPDLILQGNNPIRNPLPTQGGIDPEPIEQVRLDAPQAFGKLQRAVTEADYAEIVQRFPGVSKALATRRWTGSWYTIFITVDRVDGLPVDTDFTTQLQQFLEQFRLTGHDLEIESPRFVPLDVAMTVRVKPGYFSSEVKNNLILTFSDRVLKEGVLAFFHPDNFSFGQPVYLSQIIASAMLVAGVESVVVDRFQRQGLPAQGELETGRISCGRLEIALLNNGASRSDQGKIKFMLEGGL